LAKSRALGTQAAKTTLFAAGNEADVREKRRRRLLANQPVATEWMTRSRSKKTEKPA
jgi:hypothetical protein